MDFQTRYEFNPTTDLLGKGGFSKVYRATDTLLERTVALKFFTGSAADKYQILNEIKKVIRFEHPNLCKYYDVEVLSNKNVFGETDRIEVGIMEYIDAGDFKTYTRKHPENIDKLLVDVLKGLAYLHKHGIAHRDLKPQNVLIKIVDDEPVSKITDFGISKLIDTEDNNSSVLLGTIEYMAPEQFNPIKYGINGRITTNLDLWSFGLLVYETLCHQSFFGSRSSGISAEQVMSNILSDASLEKADTLPPKYREIVQRCLVKNASERVKNALELIPFFDNKFISLEKIHIKREGASDKIDAQITQVIEPKSPVTEEATRVFNRPPETTSEVTRVIDSTLDATTDETQLIEPATDTTANVTQIINSIPDITKATQATERISNPTEATQIIELDLPETAIITQAKEPVLETTENHTHVINSVVEPSVKTGTIYRHSNVDEIEPETKKSGSQPLKKVVLLSAVAILLIILFVAFLKRSSQRDRVHTSAPKPIPVVVPIPELVKIDGGTFTMGDTSASVENAAVPAHQVTLDGFSFGKYEVTVDQFKQFIDETKYLTTAEKDSSSEINVDGKWIIEKNINWRFDVHGKLYDSNTKNIPVVHISWTDANAYCKWLSEKSKENFRLPTEAEWEFAAGGANHSKYFFFSGSDSINQVAWCEENSNGTIHPIGQKKPNELGIYDMSGNASEWCNDWYEKDYYENSPGNNPAGPGFPKENKGRVVRGGAWGAGKKFCRNTYRYRFKEDGRGGNIGFRICKVSE